MVNTAEEALALTESLHCLGSQVGGDAWMACCKCWRSYGSYKAYGAVVISAVSPFAFPLSTVSQSALICWYGR